MRRLIILFSVFIMILFNGYAFDVLNAAQNHSHAEGENDHIDSGSHSTEEAVKLTNKKQPKAANPEKTTTEDQHKLDHESGKKHGHTKKG